VNHPARELRRLDLHARRNLGQNFLVDVGVARRIVAQAAVSEGVRVLEIGPGLGALTFPLLSAGANLVAVERDAALSEHLLHAVREQAPDARFRLVQGDVLRLDLAVVCPGSGWLCVSNLPYNVANPVIAQLLGLPSVFAALVLMVQAEVAERFVARPSTDAFGALSLEIQAAAEVEVLFGVPSVAFHPRPAVQSTVVRMVPRLAPWLGPVSFERFRRVVRAAFGQRRKTLTNALGSVFGRQAALQSLSLAGIDPRERAENLELEAFARLTEALLPSAVACHENEPRAPSRA
jgi:16S rRNA (adenine1518-N6/adenine1519-N6)-dimethyltransferase